MTKNWRKKGKSKNFRLFFEEKKIFWRISEKSKNFLFFSENRRISEKNWRKKLIRKNRRISGFFLKKKKLIEEFQKNRRIFYFFLKPIEFQKKKTNREEGYGLSLNAFRMGFSHTRLLIGLCWLRGFIDRERCVRVRLVLLFWKVIHLIKKAVENSRLCYNYKGKSGFQKCSINLTQRKIIRWINPSKPS